MDSEHSFACRLGGASWPKKNQKRSVVATSLVSLLDELWQPGLGALKRTLLGRMIRTERLAEQRVTRRRVPPDKVGGKRVVRARSRRAAQRRSAATQRRVAMTRP